MVALTTSGTTSRSSCFTRLSISGGIRAVRERGSSVPLHSPVVLAITAQGDRLLTRRTAVIRAERNLQLLQDHRHGDRHPGFQIRAPFARVYHRARAGFVRDHVFASFCPLLAGRVAETEGHEVLEPLYRGLARSEGDGGRRR